MFKKVLLFISLLLLIFFFHYSQASMKNYSLINGKIISQSQHESHIVFAAENGRQLAKQPPIQAQTPQWLPYIVPCTVGIILIFGIGSYWLIFRKKQLKKD